MKILISKHVYGSVKGYQTLAISSDVTTEEVKELESLSFGQTTDSSYLQSLKEKPAFICRKLSSSGRWAITRVFCGPQDDYGRVTLLFITALISQSDWLHIINSDLNIILSKKELWKWDGENNIPDVYMEVLQKDLIPNAHTVKNALSLLSVVESSFNKNRPIIVVRESVFSHEDIRLLNMILPQKERNNFSSSVRALSDDLPFKLICLSEGGISGKRSNNIIRWEKNIIADNAPYTKYLSKLWINNARPPWDFIRSCKSFKLDIITPNANSVKNNVKRPIISGKSEEQFAGIKISHWKRVGIVSTFSFLLCTLIVLTALKLFEYRERNKLLEEIDTFLNSHLDAMVPPENKASEDSPINKAQNLLSQVESLKSKSSDEEINARTDKLYNWLNEAKQANRIRITFSDLVANYKNLVASGPPISYPPPEDITKKLQMIRDFENQLKSPNIIGKNGVSQAKRAKLELKEQLSSLGIIMEDFNKRVSNTLPSVPLREDLKSYSKYKHEFYVRVKYDIDPYWDNDNLKNAALSPLNGDRKYAELLMTRLNKTKEVCQQRIIKLEELKVQAKSEWMKGKKQIELSEDPNSTLPKKQEYLSQAKDHFIQASNLWPKKEEIISGLQKVISEINILISETKNDFDTLRTSNDPSDYQEYIRVRDQINICHKYNPNDSRANKLKEELSEWENIEEHIDWIKAWEFINKCEEYIKQIDNLDLKKNRKNRIKTEIDKEKKSLNRENIDYFLDRLVDDKYRDLIDLIDKKNSNRDR